MDVRLDELVGRLESAGKPATKLSASEFEELCEGVRELEASSVTLRSCSGKPFVSERGAELFCTGIGDLPIITVENYLKWYSIYVVTPEGVVSKLDSNIEGFEEADRQAERTIDESVYGDHVFNPNYVIMVAKLLGMEVDPCALESIIGRWLVEHCNQYQESVCQIA